MFPFKMKLVPEGTLALGPDLLPVVVAYAVTSAMKLLEGFLDVLTWLCRASHPSKSKQSIICWTGELKRDLEAPKPTQRRQ